MRKQRVRHEKPGPPKREVYGIAAVTQALEGMEFPASKSDLLSRAGDRSIEWTKGNPVKLLDILDQISDQEYPSMAQVTAAVGGVMQRIEGKKEAA